MNIFVSIPVLGRPELRHISSVYQAISACREHKIRLYFNLNDSLISRVRNVHTSAFLYQFPECDYYMSLDSDLEIINSYPTNNIFTKLVAHDLDFVGGLYSIKSKQGVIRSASISLDGSAPKFDSGLQEMRWLSSGCWCVKRSVIQKMADAYPDLAYNGDDNATGKQVHGLYMPMLYDVQEKDFPNMGKVKIPFRKLLSEDWAFCERWKAIGGKIFADTSIVLKHIGSADYNLFNVEVIQRNKTNSTDSVTPPPGFDLK